MRKTLSLLMFTAAIGVSPAWACHPLPDLAQPAQTHKAAPSLHICHAWIRLPSPAVTLTAAYLHVHNMSSEDDILKSVHTPAAERTEIHETTITDGIARMRPAENGIAIAKSAHIEMKPGGLHIMLIGLKAPLAEEQKIPLTLTFAKRGTMTIEASVMKGPPSIEHKH